MNANRYEKYVRDKDKTSAKYISQCAVLFYLAKRLTLKEIGELAGDDRRKYGVSFISKVASGKTDKVFTLKHICSFAAHEKVSPGDFINICVEAADIRDDRREAYAKVQKILTMGGQVSTGRKY